VYRAAERQTREARTRWSGFAAAAAFAFLFTAPAAAQAPARFSLESVVAADEFAGESASGHPQFIVDVSLSVRMSDRWQIYVRPWFRLPRSNVPGTTVPPWDKELYQAAVRYERRGPIAARLDAGYILSPIGLGIYDVRPGLNPTIVPHLSYVQPMPVIDLRGPRVSAIAASYPLGAQVTVSSTRWDGRAAVLNSAPARLYALGAATNPKATPAVVVGGGVTPIVGLRVGAAVAHGNYAVDGEITPYFGAPPAPFGPPPSHLAMTMANVEAEWAFAGTKLAGEIVRTAFDTVQERALPAYEWFVQGQQTLTARWFAAARFEGTSAPPVEYHDFLGSVTLPRRDLRVVEATAGYRVNRDITLRGSYYTRRFYGATAWTNQAGVSVVWAHRWW
jgi:hypothetical protein